MCLQRMKTFVHAYQNKYDWIHLAANNGIFDLYKKEKNFHKENEMIWYHPALLSFDNHAEMSVFMILNETIQYLNSYNIYALLLSENNQALIPPWKNLLDVYTDGQRNEKKMIPHNDIVILSHPHNSKKNTTFPGNEKTLVFNPGWDGTMKEEEKAELEEGNANDNLSESQ